MHLEGSRDDANKSFCISQMIVFALVVKNVSVSLTANVLDITGRCLKPDHENAKASTAFHLVHERSCRPAIDLSAAI